MKRWMVLLHFNQSNNAQMRALLPLEQAHIRELMDQGIMEAIYIGSTGTQVWLVIHGDDTTEVEKLLSDFPLYSYFEFEIFGLN